MAAKLAVYGARAGVPDESLLRAYQIAVAQRLATLRDVFHPDLLHPARTALILLEDVRCTDQAVLTAAALCESEFAAMRVAAVDVNSFGSSVARLVLSVPAPDEAGESLAERLVTAPDDVALIAVAERLDHARHLHFRNIAYWPGFFSQITEIYLPVAARVSNELHARLTRWATAFQKRHLSRL